MPKDMSKPINERCVMNLDAIDMLAKLTNEGKANDINVSELIRSAELLSRKCVGIG